MKKAGMTAQEAAMPAFLLPKTAEKRQTA